MTIDDVLAPITRGEFAEKYLGQQFTTIHGASSRFLDLVTFENLSTALSTIRVNDGRVSLVRCGTPLAHSSYVQTSQNGSVQYLNGAAVTAFISQGATLVVNQVDELFAGVRSIAESCEDLWGVYVSANAYAGWRTDNGFDVHWDTHDTIVTQIVGCKAWKIWKPSIVHPLPGPEASRCPRPSDKPVWEGILREGGVLYMPRGWWHVAYPLDEPSLHLTFGIRHATGMDLLQWVTQQLIGSETIRSDMPHSMDALSQQRWLEAVRADVLRGLDDGVISAFMRAAAERAHARPIVRLPRTTSRAAQSVQDDTPLRLTTGRRLWFVNEEASNCVTFVSRDKVWKCTSRLVPALAMLSHVRPVTLQRMCNAVSDEDRGYLRPFVGALLMAGVVWGEQVSE